MNRRGLIVFCLSACLGAALFLDGCVSREKRAARQEESEVDDGEVSVKSPNGNVEMIIHGNGPLTYTVSYDGGEVLAKSRLGLRFADGTVLGKETHFTRVERESCDTTWENNLGKRHIVHDHHNELRLFLVEETGRQFEIVVRAFDDGIGFRYDLPGVPGAGTQDFQIDEELTSFAFPDNDICYAGINENTGTPKNPLGYIGSQESEFLPTHLSELPTNEVRMLPLLVESQSAWVAITESDLVDWAGMWVNRANDPNNMEGVTLAARLAPRLDGEGLVKSTFPRTSPWRTLIMAREPGKLIESDLVLNLATPCVLTDTSWVKPGISSWDWWSQTTSPGTATYKEFIQFSADMGWAYSLLDAGWSERSNIMQPAPAVNMDEVLAFAKERNVGLWVWAHWTTVDQDDAYKQAFPLYEKWGLAGVKIDFMNRDDQDMVNWYEKITRAAAEHHLMVNFHGAFKPTGMIRTFPNQITREGVMGNEYNRWSSRVTAEHKTTIPFTRLLAGPADFTPGGFLNVPPDQFHPNDPPTKVQGTRCAELALFVCLESPLINACDNPAHYRNQPGLDFLKIVPTVWDDTVVPDAAVGEHLVIARRSGPRWFLGALTDHRAREIPVDLDFLGPGKWKLRLWQDAADSDVNGEHLDTHWQIVASTNELVLRLAKAGGAVGVFEPLPPKP